MSKKYPIIYLLEIPVNFFLYVIVIELGAKLDAMLFGTRNAQDGSGFPIFTIVVFVLATVALIAATVYSIVKFVRAVIAKNKKRKAADKAIQDAPW